MAKYCSNCGRKLEEGEACNCKENQVPNIDFQGDLNKLINLAKGMFTSPIKTLKDFKEENNFSLACILIVITSVVIGLFAMLFAKEIYKTTLSTYSYGMYTLTNYVEISYFKIFIVSTLCSLIYYFVSALVLYLVNNKLFKANISYKNTLNVVSTLSVFTLSAVLLSVVGIFISMSVVIVLIVFATVLSLTVLVLANKEVFKLNDTHTIYSVVLYLAIIAVISYLIFLIFA